MLGLDDGISALLFDLDGVLTKTAEVHAAAWKETFDEVLQQHSGDDGVDASPFDLRTDYHRHVDGKPRYDGVRDFLTSRGIELPEGSPDDPPGDGSVCAVGNRKNERLQEIIDTRGVEAYEGSVRYLDAARPQGLKIAVVSSSANAEAVLEAAGLSSYIEVRVDGEVAREEGIPGKPKPDTFLAAAERLGVEPSAAAVFEDAISGVQAGAAGAFGAVVGVNRGDQAGALRDAGATVVVDDLAELLDEEGRS